MTQQMADPETTLRLKHVFDAPRERVFRAWTDPQELKRWWGPGGYTTTVAEVDLRVGGRYRLGMQGPEGDIQFVGGVYREVEPPERLVYTWAFEEGPMQSGPGETLVTVEFIARGDATEVALTHERLPTAEIREQHAMGWKMGFDKLAEIL